MKEVYIISTGEIVNGKTAGARRMINIARSLAAINVHVFLCSLADVNKTPVDIREIEPGIFFMRSLDSSARRRRNALCFVRTVNSLLVRRNSEIVIYLYPTVFVLKDFIYLIYFKYLKKRRFFCEINELRTAAVFLTSPPGKLFHRLIFWLKSSIDYIKYKLNEFQVCLYDGIVVISTGLEKHFFKRARKILRIPILCNATLIEDIDLPRLDPESAFKICFAGYIKPEKEGFDILFEALCLVNKNHKTELYVYGILEDQDRIRMGMLADEYCLRDKVFYKGNIDPDRLQDEFKKYNLLILPRPLNKINMYGFSTKLSEYLVSGIPVLVTDVSDNASYIADSFNGYIIPPGSSSLMAEKILEIIRDYNGQAKMVVENAHQTVREKFDYRLFSSNIMDFFWSKD